MWTEARCPPGYANGGNCPGNGFCCIKGYEAGVDAEKVCVDAGATWIPLDPCCNPYTCEVPLRLIYDPKEHGIFIFLL